MREFLFNAASSFIGFGLAVGCMWLHDEIRERGCAAETVPG